jgi:hypothetical protein
MKLFLLITTWLAFAMIANAQNCPNGQCPVPTRTTTTTTTYYSYPQAQPSRYVTLYAAPLPVVTVQPVAVYYVQPRRVGPVRRLFGW